MLCPWMVTSATRPSSTAWTKRLKLTSGSRGCCLVTIDQSKTPMSSRRSQRPRLRETGFNAMSGTRRKPLRRVTHDPGSGNARSGALERPDDDAPRARAEQRGGAADDPRHPQHGATTDEQRQATPGLPRHVGVDEHVLELARPHAREMYAVAGPGRAHEQRGRQRIGVEHGARRARAREIVGA